MSRETMDTASLVALLRSERLVPVLRAGSAAVLHEQLDVCVEAGVGVVELTATTPGWQDALARALADPDFASVSVGVGTVVTAQIARAAIEGGAQFLVSPYAVPQVRAVAATTPFIEGGLTPGELAAATAGGRPAKLYPAASVGPGHLRAVLDVLPGSIVMPTGGIRPDTAGDWIDAGAIAVGMGGGLLRLGAREVAGLRESLRSDE